MTEEQKKKAREEAAKKKAMVASSKKSGTTEPKMSKEEAQKAVKEQNEAVKKAAKEEKKIMAGRTDPDLYKTETKKEYDYTPAAQKRTQQISESVAKKATPTVSAKAVSSEAEDYTRLLSPIQRGKQQVSDNIAKAAGVKQETLDTIQEKNAPKFGKDIFSESVDSGVANIVANTIGGLEIISNLSLPGMISNAINGKEANPFVQFNAPIQNWKQEEAEEVQQAVESVRGGKAAQFGAQAITVATQMIPDVVLSFATGGLNKAASVANTGVKGLKVLTSAKTLIPALKQTALSTATNPSFWLNFEQTLYPEYEDAKAKGATETEATITALLSSFALAKIESDSGFQGLSGKVAPTLKRAVLDYVKSAVEEGNEEVVQSIASGITQKLIFDHDKKLVSITPREDAILNMADAWSEWVMGTFIGSIMSAPGAMVNAGDVVKNNQTIPQTPTAPEVFAETPEIAPTGGINAQTPVTPTEAQNAEVENVTPEVTNEQEGTFANATTYVNTSVEGKTPQQIKTLKEYVGAVNTRIKELAEMFRNNKNAPFVREKFSNVSEKQINDIATLTGIDVSGFKNGINKNGFNHIERRHGINGEANQTMADTNDVARIPWVLDNYDNAELVIDENGEPVKSGEYRNRFNELAPLVKFTKAIDGTVYVVEAVPDSDYKTLWVETAYISKKNPSDASDVNNNSPDYTSETSTLPSSSNNYIPQDSDVVKGGNKQRNLPRADPYFDSIEKKYQNYGLEEKHITPEEFNAAYESAKRNDEPFETTTEASRQVMETAVAEAKESFRETFGYINPSIEKAIEDIADSQQHHSANSSIVFNDAINKILGEVEANATTIVEARETDIRDRIRTTPIRINEDLKADFGKGWAEFLKENMGSVQFSKSPKAVSIDEFYGDLAAHYPDFFDPNNIDPKAQAEDIARFMQETKRRVVNTAEELKRTGSYGEWRYATMTDFVNGGLKQLFDDIEIARALEVSRDIEDSYRAQNNSDAQSGAHPNTVGGMESNPKSYAHLQNEYDVFEQGEQPAVRDPNVPKKDAQGNRVSQGVRTIMEAAVTTDELIPAFEKEVAEGTFENKGTSNKETVEKAAQRIANKPFQKSVNEFRELYSDDKILSKDDAVFGQLLYSFAAQKGDTDTAIELASMLSSNISRTGDALQAQRILKRLSPEGRLYHAQRITEKFNKGKQQKNKIELSEETVKKVLEAKTDEEIEAANDAVAEDIAKQIDKGVWRDLGSMWNAWRYFSMLGNPKTHIRNIFGNLAFLPARKIKNVVKLGIEGVAYKAGWIDEKTATIKGASKENKDFAKESFKKNKNALLSGGNYRFESEIDSKLEPFRFTGKETKVKKFFNDVLTPVRKVVKGNSDLLELEDVMFLKNAYIDSLTQYLTANNLDGNNLTKAQKTAAENYAAEEARKATYRDTSAIANALEKLSNSKVNIKGVKVKLRPVVDAVVPFRKTPINVLARAVEYSPVGLVTTLALDGRAVKNGDITANEMIDHISSGLTGSGIYALGIALALKGVLTGGEDEDKNEKEFAKLQGEQAYALKIGDGSYTLDWLSPTAIPLFLGAETVRVLKKEYDGDEKWYEVAWGIIKNLDKIANPMLEMSMLQNLDSFLSSNYGSEGSAIAGLALDLLASYALQAVPTLSSQVAQTMDGTRRNAYYVDKTDKIPDEWQIPLQRAMAKIPGLSQKLPAYVDAWGRTQKQSDDVGVRIVENFLSPGYYKKKTVTEADEMLKQLIAETGNTGLAPKGLSQKYVTVDGTNYPLSAKEYEQMSIEKGKKQYDIISQLIADDTYKGLKAEEKEKTIKGIYEYSGALAKEGVHGYELPEEWKKVQKAKNDGLSEETYLSLKPVLSAKNKDIDKLNYLIADKGTTAEEKVVAMEYLTSINMDKYKKFSKDPEDIINARKIYLEEDAKGGEGTTARIVERIIKDKGTSAKEDVAFMENVLNKNMTKYKQAAKGNASDAIYLYQLKQTKNAKGDQTEKEADLELIQKKMNKNLYEAREIHAKMNGDWNENISDVVKNGENRDSKISVMKRFGYSNKDITTGYNAIIGLNKKADMIDALTKAFGNKSKATTFYNICKGKKGYK